MRLCPGMMPIVGIAIAIAGTLFGNPSPSYAQSGSESTVGYIDSAIPLTQFRLRYDSAWGNNRPTRAEFFYPKSQAFAQPPFLDSRARGPLTPETNIDFQDINSYVEFAVCNQFSGFVEVPVRFLNPERNANTNGLSDITAGFKWAFIAEPDRFVTFQFRTFAPTGDGGRGLGTEHASVEPALLYFHRLNEWLVLEGELRDWIPIGGSDFAGNVLRYGVGLGATLIEDEYWRVTPVTELVGWTVLGAKESLPPFPQIENACGDTIINLKTGVRVNVGDRTNFYVGYGRALTGDVWYRDVLRVEFRRSF